MECIEYRLGEHCYPAYCRPSGQESRALVQIKDLDSQFADNRLSFHWLIQRNRFHTAVLVVLVSLAMTHA